MQPLTRRGGIYIAVLGAGMLVTLIGLTALAAVRIQRLTVSTATDAEQARLYAQSAVELGAQLVRSDPLWRVTRTNGIWVNEQPIGDGRFTLEGIDPIDGDLANRLTDPLVLRATAWRGRARQIVEARLDASGKPLDVLETALYVPGELRVRSGSVMSASGAPIVSGSTLRNDGAISGDAECMVWNSTGTISGSVTMLVPPRSLPDSNVISMYVDLGVEIAPPAAIDRRLLAPRVNPWGAGSSDGVYVIKSSEDITIRDSRIHGTLVIIAPGRRVTIAGSVLMHPARSDYPTLIVVGDLVLEYSDADLSEASLGVNFNPNDAPYEGVSNSSTVDSFSSEIRGLVHVRGTLYAAAGSPRIRGTVIAESTNASAAVEIHSPLQITYDPSLFTRPPMGYTKAVDMVITPGSWRQVVLP